MAEAFLNSNFPNSTITKKGENEMNHQKGRGKKRSHTISQVSEDIILLDHRPNRKAMSNHIRSAETVSTVAAAPGINADISYEQPIQTNSAYKR